MGLIVKIAKFTSLILISVFFAPGLPPHYEFVPFSLPEPLELKGPLAPNSILDKAKPIPLDKEIFGPESIAVRGDELYTGLMDGSLVKIKNGKVTKIGKFGEDCDNYDPTSSTPCGRIAGVRFDSQGRLLVADVVLGLFRVDVDTGKAEKLVGMEQEIEGVKPRFPDDLDIDSEGNIYFSDASTIAGMYDMVIEALAGPTGRLIKHNTKTKENTVLASKLHFPNGIQLSEKQDFVLVSETFGARVWRYYLKGKNAGTKDIFVDNLPGLPDNIRPNGRGGYYIVLASPRGPGESSPLEAIGPWPSVRRFIVRLHYFLVKALEQIHAFMPSPVMKDCILWVRIFGPVGDLEKVPFKTIIVETDGNGKITGSLQNDKGPITRLSEISLDKSWAYFGSPSLRELYKISVSELRK